MATTHRLGEILVGITKAAGSSTSGDDPYLLDQVGKEPKVRPTKAEAPNTEFRVKETALPGAAALKALGPSAKRVLVGAGLGAGGGAAAGAAAGGEGHRLSGALKGGALGAAGGAAVGWAGPRYMTGRAGGLSPRQAAGSVVEHVGAETRDLGRRIGSAPMRALPKTLRMPLDPRALATGAASPMAMAKAACGDLDKLEENKLDERKKKSSIGAVPHELTKQGEETPPKKSKKPLIAAGLAGAAPFAGMIGEKPIIHDPLTGAKGQQFKSMRELSRMAQPGDVILTAKPGGGIFKTPSASFSGSEWYHAQPVFGKDQKGYGLTGQTASLDPGSKKYLRSQAKPVHSSARAENYKNVVLMRPNKPMSKGQLKVFNDRAMERTSREYGVGQSVKNWAKDIFVPKIKGLTDRGPQTICEGNICSTVPAQAMHEATGKGVVSGKRALDTMPADYLRSSEYSLVGSRIPERAALTRAPMLRKAMPYLSRGALGLGLAGTAYGASKDPDVLGGSAGAAAGILGADHLARKLYKPGDIARKMPGVRDVLETAMVDSPDVLSTRGAVGKYVSKRLPLILAGGAAGYLGMKAIRKGVKRRLEAQEPTEKVGFAVSEYSGSLGEGRFTNYASHLPPFRNPMLRQSSAVNEELAMAQKEMHKKDKSFSPLAKLSAMRDELSKLNAVQSPEAQIAKSQKVGAPRLSAPPGPSVAQIVKPVGYGRPAPGATKPGTL